MGIPDFEPHTPGIPDVHVPKSGTVSRIRYTAEKSREEDEILQSRSLSLSWRVTASNPPGKESDGRLKLSLRSTLCRRPHVRSNIIGSNDDQAETSVQGSTRGKLSLGAHRHY